MPPADHALSSRIGRVAAALAFGLALAPWARAAQALGEDECHRDRAAMRDGVAGDRAEGVRLLDVAIAATASSSERETLVSERERLWEVEERHRALADAIWRDCMAEVRRTRRASTE